MGLKLVLFDLDGVLVDARDLHFHALNDALPREYKISEDEHLAIYDGLPTRQKLELLHERVGLPRDDFEDIEARKQQATLERAAQHIKPIPNVLETVKAAESIAQLGVVSNARHATTWKFLELAGLRGFFDPWMIFSNDDVVLPKPNPEGYLRAMATAGAGPRETLAVEDSPKGRIAAATAGCNVAVVRHPYELTPAVLKVEPPEIGYPFRGAVVIPAAGNGKRFREAGYESPKPLIEIGGLPMVGAVTRNLRLSPTNGLVVIVQTEVAQQLRSPFGFILTDDEPKGAALTVLPVLKGLPPNCPVLLANCDQLIEANLPALLWQVESRREDGGILTFPASDKRWSYAAVDERGLVTEVREKDPFSPHATCGIYYWARAGDAVRAIEAMVAAEDRVNGEFYLAPAFNYAIREGARIRALPVERMIGLGTPEDLQAYLATL